ncbi:hypothetical protein [Mycoplasma sp. P36-A1]|uniref:hypothetical protein n=1 Tax=Mycoplasma sp. P36-A1 TaxID=3252900 RepID=UPI003C2C03E9
MEIKDILFINYEICQSKSATNNALFVLTKDCIEAYYKLLIKFNKEKTLTEKEIAIRSIFNHQFNLMYELLVNIRYELFNSGYRLSRSILENKVLMEFIYIGSDQQSYWYNKWHYIKKITNNDDTEIANKQENDKMTKYLYNSFCATHEKIYGSDYGFAQETLGNQYISMKDIMYYIDNTSVTYSYYKLFSDLSHGSNERSNKYDYLLRNNLDFNENTETGIYLIWYLSLKKIIGIYKSVEEQSIEYQNLKKAITTVQEYIVENNIYKNDDFKNFINSLDVPIVE